MGPAAATNVRPAVQRVTGGGVCRVLDACGFPADATVVHDKNGQQGKETQFFPCGSPTARRRSMRTRDGST
jgi:hypothetical protein